MSASNTEVVVAPFDIWYADVGEIFPDPGSDFIHPAWKKLGKDQSRSMDESGIRMNRNASDGEFRGYGAGRVRKLWTVSEDLSLEFMMADFTMETLSLLIEDGQTVRRLPVSHGVRDVRLPSGNPSRGSAYVHGEAVTFSAPDQDRDGAHRAQGTVIASGGGALGRTARDAVTITDAGAGYTSPPTVTFTNGSGAATITVRLEDRNAQTADRLPPMRNFYLGRRGASLAKAQFAFLLRGAASPYKDGARCQINIPCGSFEGARELSMTRADPIKYSCVIRCVEDNSPTVDVHSDGTRLFNGYATVHAVL